MSYKEIYLPKNNIFKRIINLFRLSYVTYEAQPLEKNSALHSHDFTEILFISEGLCKFYCDGALHNLQKGSLVLIPPGCEHYEICIPKKSLNFYCISFYSLDESLFKENFFYLADKDYEYLLMYFTELFKDYENNLYKNQLFSQNLAENLLIYILRKTNDNILSPLNAAKGQEVRIFFSVKQTKEFIDKNFHTKIIIDELARSAFLSTGHFIKQFKNLTGLTPLQYLLEKRISAAITSLEYTNKPINVICNEICFSDINNFIKKFKQKTGKTPQYYRQNSPYLKKGTQKKLKED